LNFSRDGRINYLAFLSVLLLVLSRHSADGQGSSASIEGDYLGQLGQLHLMLHIRHDESGILTGTLDSLDQRANGIRCGNLISSGIHLSFEVPSAHGTFKGEFSPDGNTLTGTWTQGLSSSLTFTRQESIREPAKDEPARYSFQFAGKSRTYYFFIPDGDGPLPLVVLLHGGGRNGQVMVEAWRTLASKEHFIVVAPDSYDPSGWSVKIDSPAFFQAVVEQVAARHAIDVRRIYLFGHSAGAVHALVLALIDSEYYAAVAVHAGALPPGYEKVLFSRVVRRMPIDIWVGDKDPLFPVDAVSKTKQLFENNGFHVGLIVIPNHDHNYYAMSDQIDAQAWDFFKKSPLTRAPSETTSYLELSIQQLKKAVPGLKGIKYDPSQERLPSILDQVARTIGDLLPRLPDLVSREDIYHFQGAPDPTAPGGYAASQPWTREFKFLLQCRRNTDGSTTISESRIDSHGRVAADSGLFTGLRGYGFAYQWLFFSESNQPEFRFRYLGQQEKSGHQTFAIAFMQDPHKVADPAYFQSLGKQEPFYYQGVLWVDQSSFAIVSLRSDLLAPLPDLNLIQLTTELVFRSVSIQGYKAAFWLPSEVDISTDQGAGLNQESHRYSDYHLFHAEAKIVASPHRAF
jgi:predicted esterase